MKRPIATAVAIVAAVAAALLIPSPAQAHSADATRLYVHSSGQGWCLETKVPLSPAPGAQRTWDVALAWCQPFRWTPRTPREADVLTHGATYTHTYWDWPQQPDQYSYVGRALHEGRATLSYDRIGNGASTRPNSTEVTMTSDAWVLHQLIALPRLWGVRYVHSIGHSYGSGVVLAEAKQYEDVTSIVLTGYLHRPSNPQVTAGNYPANQDAKFADQGLDNGWLTTRPGARAFGFHAPDSDPAVVAYDEDHKDLVSLTGLLDFLAQRGVPAGDNISNQITIPVLVLVGEQDAIFCYNPTVFNCSDQAALLANEAPFYTNASTLKVASVPGSGHDLALHPTGAGASFKTINDWIEAL